MNPRRNALSTHVSVHPRFARSINVERDVSSGAIDGYILTGRTLEVLRRFAGAMTDSSCPRAISATGPYGSGKSSMAVFLDALLAGRGDEARSTAEEKLANADRELLQQFHDGRNALRAEPHGFIRGAVVAGAEPVASTLHRALVAGARRHFTGRTPTSKIVRQLIRDVPGVTTGSAHSTVTQLRAAIEALTQEAPVVLVIDEFGKNLEHFVQHPAAGDLHVLQELAEAAAGEKALPLFLITLQHLSFQDYLSSGSAVQRREWSKIQGRFEDVPFTDSAQQLRELVATALDSRRGTLSFRRQLDTWADDHVAVCADLGIGEPFRDSRKVARFYPLHPVAMLVLPDLCARYGQNERSLFSFLAGHGPHTVSSFLDQTLTPTKGPLPNVSLDQVYDYFLKSAPQGAAPAAKRWLEVETRIRDAQGLDDEELRTLKTVGLLNLVATGGSVRASKGIVEYCLGDLGPSTVRRTLKRLQHRGILTFRGFADEYRVWQGSDIDVDSVADALRRRLEEGSLAVLLQRVRPAAPVVAGRHSYQKAVLRYFECRYGDQANPNAVPPAADDPADGLLVFWLDESNTFPARVIGDDEKPLVVVHGAKTEALREAVIEVAAATELLEKSQEVRADWVARKELRERLAAAQQSLDAKLQQSLGISNLDLQWIVMPQARVLAGRHTLSGLLSDVCDEFYRATPNVANEMLSRRVLTTQASRARRELLEAMVTHGDSGQLSLEGFGPEVAMYRAALLAPGIHRPGADGAWTFGPPSDTAGRCWQTVWTTIEESLRAAGRRLTVSELYTVLKAPPIGLKDGPLPVLLTAFLLSAVDDVAIYEDGTYQAELTPELLERLARNPDRFELKYYALDSRSTMMEAVGQAIGVNPTRSRAHRRNTSLVAILSALVRVFRGLPEYSKRTKTLSARTIGVRQAITTAREPDELLFQLLPDACECAPFPANGIPTPEEAEVFAERLRASVVELNSAFHEMTERASRHLFSLDGTGSNRLALGARAALIARRVAQPETRAFVNALADTVLDDDGWMDNIGMNVVGRTMATWSDDDYEQYTAKVGERLAAFHRLEAVYFEAAPATADRTEPVRVVVTNGSGAERSKVLWLRAEAADAVQEITERFVREVSGVVGNRDGAELAILSAMFSPTGDAPADQ